MMANDGNGWPCAFTPPPGIMNNRLPLFTVVIAPSISAMRVRKDMSLSSVWSAWSISISISISLICGFRPYR
ncbi:hypothetical protein BX70_06595 [Escherichia coli O111:NM str. 2010C-4622]|nr:hypothetical protein BX70_06595 [Escherichia coli O111:NM str. 2010C-4622]